ncbi:MAG: hypothetical protein ABIQ30_01430 [Devosia sp.]
MSFREKAAWIAVFTTLPIWGYYFYVVWSGYWALTLDRQNILSLFLICLAVTVAILLGLNLLSAYLGKHKFGADLDELERSIDARANEWGARLLEWLALGVAAASPWASGIIAAAYPASAVPVVGIVAANAILFVVLVSQIVHELIHIIGRRVVS